MNRLDALRRPGHRALIVCGVLILCGLAATSAVAQGTRSATSPIDAALAKYMAKPVFTPPGPAFNASALRGKSIFNIPATSTVPFVTQIDATMAKVAKKYGIKFTEYTNQGQPSQWVAGMGQAIAQKADLIILSAAIDPALLRPQIAAATKAGIPVLDTHFYDFTQPAPAGVELVRADFKQAATLDAYWIMKQTGMKANVLVVTSPELQLSKLVNKTHADVFKKMCPACKVTYLGVSIADLATKLQSGIQSALLKDPSLNSIILEYDAMSQFAVPALTVAGKNLPIATFNGTDFVLNYIAKGKVGMDVGENLDWLGYADMDQAMRMLSGLPTVKSENTPLRVFDATNVKEAGTPAKTNAGYGNAYVAGYNKIWSGK